MRAAFDWAPPPLAVATWVVLLGGCGAAPPPVDSPSRAAGDRASGVADEDVPLDIPIDALLGHVAPAIDERRNPFRFGATTGGGRDARGARAFAPVARKRDGTGSAAPAGVTGTPAAPPAHAGAGEIRFIGVVEARNRPGRVAVLTDGDGVYHGLVNNVVKGRYRILAIDADSVEVEDVTRGTRMSLRLSGF